MPFAVAASMLCVSAIGFIFISRQRKPQAVSGQHQATKLSEKAKSQSLAASVSGSTFLEQTELVADGKNTSAVPFGQLLRLPVVWGSCLSNVCCFAALTFFDPTLQVLAHALFTIC